MLCLVFARIACSALLTGSARRVEFPLFCAPLFDLYDLMFAATSGRFTPTIADSLLRMGYGHVYGSLGEEPVVWGVTYGATMESRTYCIAHALFIWILELLEKAILSIYYT